MQAWNERESQWTNVAQAWVCTKQSEWNELLSKMDEEKAKMSTDAQFWADSLRKESGQHLELEIQSYRHEAANVLQKSNEQMQHEIAFYQHEAEGARRAGHSEIASTREEAQQVVVDLMTENSVQKKYAEEHFQLMQQ